MSSISETRRVLRAVPDEGVLEVARRTMTTLEYRKQLLIRTLNYLQGHAEPGLAADITNHLCAHNNEAH